MDLIGIADIGEMDLRTYGAGVLAVSPDGTRIAFSLRRANPATNDHCVQMIVLALDGKRAAQVVDRGGGLLRFSETNRGITGFGSGYPSPVLPRWSPDGQWIAYLRADNDGPQLWRAAANGTGALQLTDARSDVTDFAWTPDGVSLVFSSQPALADASRQRAAEARSGFVYDDRFWSLDDNKPRLRAPLARAVEVVAANGMGSARRATDSEAAMIGGMATDRPPGALRFARRADGSATAWTESAQPGRIGAPTRLRISGGPRTQTCDSVACSSGIIGLWWVADTLVFERQEFDRGRGEIALYRWNVASSDTPQLIERTTDVWTGCTPAATRLVCEREGSAQPRRIIAIDPASGSSTLVFDPNPDFNRFRIGTVHRLQWQEAGGQRDFGDLVLPADHILGQRHPLIVVQYQTQGFLRGGTGDEFPIQLFAQAGYAVLIFDDTPVYRRTPPSDDMLAVLRREALASSMRFALLGAIQLGVDKVISMGVVDPKRIGITGVSDGATTVCFALIHSARFKVAEMSSGCNDPVTTMAMAGPGETKFAETLGYPHPGLDPAGFWKDNGLSVNADHITASILIQASDAEFRSALESFAAFRARSRPFELIVFPGEYHFKYQPAHRLAAYIRSLDWFDFWLRGIEHPDSGAEQYQRWRAMRDKRDRPALAAATDADARWNNGAQGITEAPPALAPSQASTSPSINRR
jgi:dipeptidyl aminopeptidase/acylaminoacyl peptidase